MLDMLIIPMMGGIIGYITNDIAIKMLFRPRRAIYIGKWRLPFTPGLIPREKHRIAKSIGEVVSRRLLDEETVRRALTSDEIERKIQEAIIEAARKNMKNTKTVGDIICECMPDGKVRLKEVKAAVTALVQRELTSIHPGDTVAQYIFERIKQKLDTITLGIAPRFIDGIASSLAEGISDAVNQAVKEYSVIFIPEIVEDKLDKIKDVKIGEIIEKYKYKLPYVAEAVTKIYTTVINKNISKALQGINVAKIVEDKINAFDACEMENLIFGIMRKELKAIVYLGALLGFALGWVNVLINYIV